MLRLRLMHMEVEKKGLYETQYVRLYLTITLDS
jgi:hypothetical protein